MATKSKAETSRPGKAAKVADAAWAAMVEAAELHTRWCTELDTRRAELDQLRQRAGEAALSDPDAGADLGRQLAELAAQVEVAERAVAAAAARVPPGRRKLIAARAAVLADRAAAVERVVADRQAATDRMLAELSEWEGGARYVPYEPTRGEVETASQPLAGLTGLAGASGIRYRLPLTETFRREAAGLRAEADRLAKLAESGSDDQITAAVSKDLPPSSEREREAIGAG